MKAAPGIAVVIPALDERSVVARAVSSAFASDEHVQPGWRAMDGPVPEHDPMMRPDADEASSEALAIDVGEAATEALAIDVGEAAAEVLAIDVGEAAIEVLVIDGGSRDGTAEVARRAGAWVVETAAGRGRQLDLGWRSARAGTVLFLHADSMLPVRWREAVERALEDPSVAGGAFRLGFDEPGLRWRLLELGVRLRVQLLKLPYGDQAIFVRRSVLEASGGVPHVEILEDLDLVRSIRRAGRLALLPETVRTSGRRHRGGGLVRTIARHALALAGFYLDLDRGWIARKVRG